MTQEVNPMFVKLRDVQENACISDMNYLFHYHRLKAPDQVLTNYFALFYKEAQQEQWSTCKNILSNEFTVAKTSLIIDQIKANLGGDVSNEKHFRETTSVKSTFALTGYQINNVTDESESDLILFNLLTNVVATTVTHNPPKLTFNILNGFAGNMALSLSFGILKSIRTTIDDIGTEVSLNNVFLLDHFTKRLIHNESLSINIEDVVNVQNQIQNQINAFKRFSPPQIVIEELVALMPKKASKKFVAMWDSLPDTFKNWYYCSYVLTAIIDSEKRISLEIKLRAYVTQKMRSLIRSETAV